ncbi:Retrotransposon protein, putative, Ty3-gypsy subclass [Quillaja saponaria]|uniref:Retrotransposon protein, putative, Ty3-gypsy subclass n=1 Tax=Quillaja saponaria TaxID=32244 RepID=A0AAD7PBX1_QUISA|nr:Retrotransposon protein, putative, Ty3-gypsy subclass [Quillaja saponaria]
MMKGMTNQQKFDWIDSQLGELAGVSDSMIDIQASLKEFDIPGLIERVTTLEGLVSRVRALERNKNVQGTGDNAAELEERVSSIDQSQAQLEGAVHTMRGEILEDMAIMKDELGELNTKVNITMRAVGNDNHNPYAEGVGQRRMKVPEPRAFGGARDAKELENFLFDMEQYFRAVRMDSEEAKVTTATMYLAGDAKLWWRIKYVDIQDGRCVIDTWEDLRRELKAQFFPENVEYIARRNLRELKQTGTIREYVKRFAGLMLDIRDMSEKDKMFYFLEGLKPWARAELQRQRPRMGALRFIGALKKHAESSKKSGDKGLMFVKGHLGGKPATSVMLDTGATHNFVSEAEAKKLGLKLEKDSGQMKAVNSKSLPTAGQAKQVSGTIWHWGEPCQIVFEDMKLAMINDPVLALPDISKPFEVQTDASDYTLGGVLLQENHLVAYESHKLSQAEMRYTAQEKEMLAVIHCLRVWRHYLLGSKFIVKTDNTGVSHFFTQPKLTPKQGRWHEFLAEFDFEFEHKAGKSNQAADALSRKAELAAMTYVAHISASRVATSMRERIRENLDKDPVAQAIINLAKEGKTRQFWVEDGLLMAKGSRLFVPKAGDLRRTLMKECHDTLWAGHPGWQRTYALLKQGYYWPQMREDAVNYSKTCLICQQDKVERKKIAGLLEPLPVPTRPWERVLLRLLQGSSRSYHTHLMGLIQERVLKHITLLKTGSRTLTLPEHT